MGEWCEGKMVNQAFLAFSWISTEWKIFLTWNLFLLVCPRLTVAWNTKKCFPFLRKDLWEAIWKYSFDLISRLHFVNGILNTKILNKRSPLYWGAKRHGICGSFSQCNVVWHNESQPWMPPGLHGARGVAAAEHAVEGWERIFTFIHRDLMSKIEK